MSVLVQQFQLKMYLIIRILLNWTELIDQRYYRKPIYKWEYTLSLLLYYTIFVQIDEKLDIDCLIYIILSYQRINVNSDFNTYARPRFIEQTQIFDFKSMLHIIIFAIESIYNIIFSVFYFKHVNFYFKFEVCLK